MMPSLTQVLAFTALAGLEGAVTNWRVFSDMWVGGRDFLKEDFFKSECSTLVVP